MNKTTIAISEENKLFLDGIRIHKRETYDDIMTRIREAKRVELILKEEMKENG